MKNFKSILASLSTAALMTAMALSFNACTEQSPMQVGGESTSITRAPGELNILKSTSPASLKKAFVSQKLITVAQGGKIEVGDNQHGKSRLNFKSGDVSQNVLVTFSWESTGLLEGGAEFSPHGTVFNNPVQIRLSYKDADLTGINEEDIKIWYFNEEDGVWELIAGEVHSDDKFVQGYIEHFSRYAIGTE